MKHASATAPITLGTLATDAGIQVGPFGSQLHVSDYSKTGVAVVMPAQIDGETIRFDECARIQETKAESLNAHRLIPGDIVFARRGDIGRLAVVPHGAASAICGTGCIRVRLQPGTSPAIVAAACRTRRSREWLIANSVGMTMLNINQQTLARLPLSIPPRQLHAAIERTLCSSQSSVEFLSSLIAAKREQKRGLMQQLLTGKVRFPGFTEPWKTVRLGAVLAESRIPGSTGAVARKITIKLYGRGVHAKIEKRPGSENTRYFRRCTGQLIYSKLDCLNGAFGIVPAELDGFESTLDMPAFDVHSKANSDWLLAVVGRPSFYSRFRDGADGSRKAQRVDPTRFLAEHVELPTRDEQDRIAATHAAMTCEINLLVEQRSALASQRRGLLERLLSGDIALPFSDTSAG